MCAMNDKNKLSSQIPMATNTIWKTLGARPKRKLKAPEFFIDPEWLLREFAHEDECPCVTAGHMGVTIKRVEETQQGQS